MENISPAFRTLRFLFIPLFVSASFPMPLFVLLCEKEAFYGHRERGEQLPLSY